MDYRIGKCSQCGAEYRIPTSFAHSAARCKQCKGVVHLGPPPGGAATEPAAPAASAMPAKKVVPKPAAPAAPRPAAEAPKPAERPPAPQAEPAAEEKKGGTLERLKAQRAAAAGTPAPAPAPAPTPAARPSAAAAPAAKTPVVAARAATPAAPAGRGAGRKGAAAEEDDSGSKRAGRRGAKERPEKKKKSPAGLLSIVGLVVVGAALFLFKDKLFGGDAPAEGEGSTVNAGTTPEAGAPSPETAAAEATPEPTPEPVAEREEAAPAEPEKKPDPKVKDPASVDLAAIADFGPTPDTTPEEWTKLQETVVQMLDTEAGAASTKARRALLEQKRKAVPAILNAFKKLDFATDEGRKSGDLCQSTLKDIWNGTNFDWRYPDPAAGKPVTDPGDVWFCKRSTELWCSLWKQAEANIEVWIERAKLEEKDPDEAKRLRETFGQPGEPAAESGGGDGGDLDVD